MRYFPLPLRTFVLFAACFNFGQKCCCTSSFHSHSIPVFSFFVVVRFQTIIYMTLILTEMTEMTEKIEKIEQTKMFEMTEMTGVAVNKTLL